MTKQSISASIRIDQGTIAPVVLMPGDPLRAKHIAQTYLENPVCFNTVRNMLGYTGTYQGKTISVMGHGMGCPSMGIYASELYSQMGVEAIIRIGSAGALQADLPLGDVVMAMACYTDSSMGSGSAFGFPCNLSPVADYAMLEAAVASARKRDASFTVGPVLTSDFFYHPQGDFNEKLASLGVLAVEMEIFALYLAAAQHHKKALGMVTISDQLVLHQYMDAQQRQLSFSSMMEIALDTALTLA